MNERINDLRLEAGISQLQDDPRLVVIDREGNVIDPLVGLEKFAELIIRDCAELAASPDSHLFADTAFNKGYFSGRSDAAFVIRAHFGVEE